MFNFNKITALKSQITLIVLLISTSLLSQEPFALEAISGSRAPWGIVQYLVIEDNGQVTFYQGEANTPDTVVFTMTLSTDQMFAIRDTILAVDFFNLDELYEDDEIADGTGVSVSIATSADQHAVEAYNIGIVEINRIARTLNAFFEPNGFRMLYDKIDED